MTSESQESVEQMVERIARAALSRGVTVAVAESLTSGALATALGAGPDSSSWFAGGVVAYQPEVKWDVLDVPRGPVVTAEAARAMSAGVARLLGTEVGLAVTGVGGPGSEEGQPAGTVFVAMRQGDELYAERFLFEGDPDQVVEETVRACVALLVRALADDRAESARETAS